MFAMFTCSFVDLLTPTSPLFSTQLTSLFDFYHYREHTDKVHIFEVILLLGMVKVWVFIETEIVI